MNIIVCGTRNANCAQQVFERLQSIVSDADEDILIITGGAPGPDTYAHNIATGLGFGTRVYPANWSLGRRAGPMRNEKMLTEGKPDLVIAFWDGKSRGTSDMLCRAERAGVKLEVVRI